MTIPEESKVENTSAPAGVWHRRLFQAPAGAPWVPDALSKLAGQPATPALRLLQAEPGGWSVEEFVAADRLPLTTYLTKTSAPVWIFVSIVQQCLTGVIALHDQGIWHGAISPRSILVDPSGNVTLAGCGANHEAPAWIESVAVFNTAPPLQHSLAVADLRDLGRAFRAVLGGDADVKMTESRPDVAPLVAEWIDWLADPAPGREPDSASQAETIFTDIRTGRSGWRPWRTESELPPEINPADEHQPPAPTEKERIRLARRIRLGHGMGMEWRGPLVFGLITLSLLSGGAWFLHHFLSERAKDKPDPASLTLAPPQGTPVNGTLYDESGDFSASGGDIEPVMDTAENIIKLLKSLSEKAEEFPDWEKELERQREERERVAKGEAPGKPGQWLYEPEIFPPMGTASPGREPGDYYLVWRTQNVILTAGESRTLQSAILRSARYCGVRILAWTVLPNHAAVVLRVPPRGLLADEKLERRIAILRGEKKAAEIIASVNAKLKAGDQEGADRERLAWSASMGSAIGFYSVTKTVPVMAPGILGKAALWQAKPLHLSLLNPDSPDLPRAAAIVDTAAMKSRLVESASAWPTSSLTAAMLDYGPALRAISVLMQRNPQASLPLPPKEDLANSLRSYRRFLGDLPPEPPAPDPPPDIAPAPATDPIAPPVSSAKN